MAHIQVRIRGRKVPLGRRVWAKQFLYRREINHELYERYTMRDRTSEAQYCNENRRVTFVTLHVTPRRLLGKKGTLDTHPINLRGSNFLTSRVKDRNRERDVWLNGRR